MVVSALLDEHALRDLHIVEGPPGILPSVGIEMPVVPSVAMPSEGAVGKSLLSA